MSRRTVAEERGIAVVSVLLVTTILAMLVATTLAYGSSSQRQARRDQDWNAALPAAEAGIDDYLTRLNNNAAYVLWSTANPDPSNPAFAGFVSVGSANGAAFRYTVDASSYGQNGTIAVTSTGQVGKAQRVVRATLRRSGFIDFLYFTDFETKDPAYYSTALGDDYTPAEAASQCGKYYYGGRDIAGRSDFSGDTDGNVCTEIQFADGDVINGPLHSNDAIRLAPNGSGPQFLGAASTSWNAAGQRWVRSSGYTGTPSFARAGDPAYVVPKLMPATNGSLRQEAVAEGCLFTGPTRLRITATTWYVTSPFTKSTNCYSGVMGNTERAITRPANGVMYVQNVPSSPSDANYTSGCPYGAEVKSHPLGDELLLSSDVTPYGCRDGDLFVSGTLDGQLTVSTDNDVVIVWDLLYAGGLTGDDLLGLIAKNSVKVYHPVNSSGSNLDVKNPPVGRTKFSDPVIQASLLSLAHSFTVQNYRQGADLGTLSVDGSISQRYRGPVGTCCPGGSRTGYIKDYVYDGRLRFLSPPSFLEPVDAPWGVTLWEER
jgi:hypothetical protein